MTELIEERCSECKGDGYFQIPALNIFRVCKLCGGTGKTDWISNVNKSHKKQIDNDMLNKLFRNNIERLIYQLKEECFQATGMSAHIEIKMENDKFDQFYLRDGFNYDKAYPKNKAIQI